jgi:hypothetical protein
LDFEASAVSRASSAKGGVKREPILLDISTETARKLGPAFAKATAEVEAASDAERRALARTSDNEAILTILSEKASAVGDYDEDVVELLLENKRTPLVALKKIADSRTTEYASEISEMTKREEEDLKVTPSEKATLSLIQHQNARDDLLTKLSRHPSWKIRYAVAMQPRSTEEVLKELVQDQNLAVRAVASRRLGLPLIDDSLGVKPNCLELDEIFRKIRKNIFSSKKLADALAKQFKEADDRFDYSGADHFHDSCIAAIEELRERIVQRYVARVRAKHLPNLDLSSYVEKFPILMGVFGKAHFDAYIIAAKLRELIDQRATLSLSELQEKARDLLPYVSHNNDRGPAYLPEQILDGKRLRLHAYPQRFMDEYSIDYTTLEKVEALDQLSTVVLTKADPATVRCKVAESLHYRRGAAIFGKIPVGDGTSGLVAIRFFKNGNFIAEYATAEEAEKVAKALVVSRSSVT